MPEDREQSTGEPRLGGRYVRCAELAVGGMAVVYLGRLVGEAGFSRTVAIKSLQDAFASDREIVAMLIDEARLVSRVQHPNVVPTLDVVREGRQLHLVMEYVHGVTLAQLLSADGGRARLAPEIAVTIVANALEGLHAAHEARDEMGEPLGIVHRDISPQNILVGADGIARVLDFGLAKARGRLQASEVGQVKGKLAYMAPEQLQGGPVDRRADLYAAGVVLWEALTGQRLFQGDSLGEVVGQALLREIPRPSRLAEGIPEGLDRAVMKALAQVPGARFETAHAMAEALDEAIGLAPAREVAKQVARLAEAELARRASLLQQAEQATVSSPTMPASTREPAVSPALLSEAGSFPSVSRVASVSVAPTRRAPWLALAALALLLGGAWALLQAAPAAQEIPLAASSFSRELPSPPRASTAPESAPSATLSPTVSAETRPTTVPSAGTSAKITIASAPVRAPKSPPVPDCRVPFTLDQDGVRIPKRGCR